MREKEYVKEKGDFHLNDFIIPSALRTSTQQSWFFEL